MRSIVRNQNVKLYMVIGIRKASSYDNGLMPINTQKMVCGDQYMVLFRDIIISLLYYMHCYCHQHFALELVMFEGRFCWKSGNCTFLNGEAAM